MAQVINTNVGALFAGAALNKSAIALQTAQQRSLPACASIALKTMLPAWPLLQVTTPRYAQRT